MTDEVAVSRKGAELSGLNPDPGMGWAGGVPRWGTVVLGPHKSDDAAVPHLQCRLLQCFLSHGLWSGSGAFGWKRGIRCGHRAADRGGYPAHSQAAPKPEAGFIGRSQVQSESKTAVCPCLRVLPPG